MLQMMWDAARGEIEKLYEDRCDIVVSDPEKDPETGITRTAERTLYTALPCRLSFLSSPAAEAGMAPLQSQSVKLFLAPEAEIPPGCRIDVTRMGKTTRYKGSGPPAMYPTHQEITLSLYEETP